MQPVCLNRASNSFFNLLVICLRDKRLLRLMMEHPQGSLPGHLTDVLPQLLFLHQSMPAGVVVLALKQLVEKLVVDGHQRAVFRYGDALHRRRHVQNQGNAEGTAKLPLQLVRHQRRPLVRRNSLVGGGFILVQIFPSL